MVEELNLAIIGIILSIGFGTQGLLILGLNRRSRKLYENSIKHSIKKTMQEVNVIFQQTYSLSNDYDYNEESATHKLINFLRRNGKKLDNFLFIIQHNSSLIKLNQEDNDKVERFLSLGEWFSENYTFYEKPLPQQISQWRTDRKSLHKFTSDVEELSEIFCD